MDKIRKKLFNFKVIVALSLTLIMTGCTLTVSHTKQSPHGKKTTTEGKLEIPPKNGSTNGGLYAFANSLGYSGLSDFNLADLSIILENQNVVSTVDNNQILLIAYSQDQVLENKAFNVKVVGASIVFDDLQSVEYWANGLIGLADKFSYQLSLTSDTNSSGTVKVSTMNRTTQIASTSFNVTNVTVCGPVLCKK